MGTAIKHPVPDVKNYKWRLNPVWHRMLYSCTHMATVGFKGLNRLFFHCRFSAPVFVACASCMPLPGLEQNSVLIGIGIWPPEIFTPHVAEIDPVARMTCTVLVETLNRAQTKAEIDARKMESIYGAGFCHRPICELVFCALHDDWIQLKINLLTPTVVIWIQL